MLLVTHPVLLILSRLNTSPKTTPAASYIIESLSIAGSFRGPIVPEHILGKLFSSLLMQDPSVEYVEESPSECQV